MTLYVTPKGWGFDCNLIKDGVLLYHYDFHQMSLIELEDELENVFSSVFGNYEIEILENKVGK
jgi:hypothetical protein